MPQRGEDPAHQDACRELRYAIGPMRRLVFALVLPFLLLSAQHGSFVHALEHLPGRSAPAKLQDAHSGQAKTYCEQCFEFAHVGAAVDAAIPLPFVPGRSIEAAIASPASCVLAEPRSARCRGPPVLL